MAYREVARRTHTVRMTTLTSGTVAALQRSPEQQSILQVPFLQASVSGAVLQSSAESQPLLYPSTDFPSSLICT